MRDHPTKDRPPSRGANRSPGARPPRGKGPQKPPQAEAKFARAPRKKIMLAASSGENPVGPRREPSPKRAYGAANRTNAAANRPDRGGERKPSRRRDAESSSQKPDGETAEAAEQRIAKVMARAGACSRRDAEAWIGEGRVALNGVILTNPAINVGDHDAITIDGEPLARRARTRLFLFHKPRGLVTTERDPEGRPTLFDHLREHWPEGPRVVSIGRLDINTEGLLLLTNDGGLARLLELPSTGWVRRYRVRAKGETDQSVLDRLRQGVSVDGVDYAGIEATLDREQGANSWLTLALREGKNREIKRVLEHIGLTVNRLIRLSFGPFQLGELAEGAVEEVRLRVLRDQLGPSLAAAAGVDFTSPIDEGEETRARLEPRPREPVGPRAGADRGDRDSRRGARGPIERRPRDKAPSEPEPRTEPRFKPVPGPRKHVSALRSEAGAEREGPRKRIERRETADRSGRTVHVERLVAAESRAAKRSKGPDGRLDQRAPPNTRNGRRFEAERKERDGASARPPRRAEGASAGRDAPGQKRERWQKPTGPQERPAFAGRKAAPDRTSAPSRSSAKSPSSYAGKFESGRGRPEKGAPGERTFAPKRFEERSRSAAPKNKTDGARPPRAGGPMRGGAAGSGRPPGGRSPGGRPGGGGGVPRGNGAGKGRPRGKF